MIDFQKMFNNYQSVLEKYKEELYSIGFYPENFRSVLKTITSSKDEFSYSSSPIKLTLPKRWVPSHTLPTGLEGFEITLDIRDEIKIKILKDDVVEDPISQLIEFNVVLNSDRFTSSWHLDRHVMQPGDGENKYLHPLYHWTFGGYHIEQKYNDSDFGNSLFMRNPRLMHPPMELILGLDFIFTQFIPSDEFEMIKDKVYLDLMNELKNYFWRPYALAFARHFCDDIAVNRNQVTFDSVFVSSVVKCQPK